MADLSNIEKRSLERLLEMNSGYVLDFSNRSFEEFVFDSVGKNIYDSKYDYASGSKANRLRAFWNVEPNHIVGKLLDNLITFAAEQFESIEAPQLQNCKRIAQRLKQSAPVSELDAISPNSAEKSFEALAKSVKEAIEKNEPEAGLDRLHTFFIKYIRVLCSNSGLSVDREKPLHSLIGELVKYLKDTGAIESEMTERILKSSISTFEAFNKIRNEHSFAHDNLVLNYEESLLIYNHVTSTIRFLDAIKSKSKLIPSNTSEVEDDIPF